MVAKPDTRPLIRKAVEICGSQSELARRLGVRQGHVWKWLHRVRTISAERAIQIEKVTGGQITRHQLRPDIFGPPPAALREELEEVTKKEGV